jgi:hypothetical protein
MADDSRVQVRVDFSEHLRPDLAQAILEAAEAEGFDVVPGSQPSIGYKDLHSVQATLTILHEVEKGAPLAVLAATLVRGAVGAIRLWKHRPSMDVKVIYGPTGEVLKRVEVPREDEA